MEEELLKGLTEEQLAKIKACKDQEEILALAKKEGIELTDEQLAAVSGGCTERPNPPCPHCGKSNSTANKFVGQMGVEALYRCNECGHRWM